MKRFLAIIVVLGVLGGAGAWYLLKTADEMAPEPSTQEVSVDVDLPR